MRQFRESMSGSSPAPYAPGFEPKMRVVARRRSPCVRLVGQDVRAQVVRVGGLVEVGHGPHRVVEQRDDVRERVPEEAGDAQRDVDAGPAQLVEAARPRSR